MTPTDPPADPDDGLDRAPTDDELAVHAVLDGEATAAQRRRVAGDPALRAQVTEMKAVVDQVASPPTAPGEDVFEAIRAAAASHLGDPEEVLDLRDQALDADADHDADEDAAADEPGADEPDLSELETPLDAATGPGGAVVPFDRPARRARRRWPALPAVAAAILVLVALGVGLIVTDGDDRQADFTAVSGSADADQGAGGGREQESTDAASRELEDDGEAGGSATTTSPGAASDGAGDAPATTSIESQASFPDDAALRDVLQQVDPATLVLDPGPDGFEQDRLATNLRRAQDPDVARCSAVLESSDADIGPAQAALAVEVGGDVLLVLSSPVAASDAEPARVLLHVVDPVSCVPRFAVQR